MDDAASRDLLRPFGNLPDPRARNLVHPLANILLTAIMAVTCGADDWASVHRWAKAKGKWLATFLDLSADLPSRDTFRRLFAALDPDAFERRFMDWTAALAKMSKGQLIAIDGKTLRRSFHRASGQKATHMVNAWCSSNRLVLGQLATDLKSNEVTATPSCWSCWTCKGPW